MTAVNNVVLAYNGTQVTIAVTKPERNMTNKLQSRTLSKSETGGSSGTTKILNMRMIDSRFSVDGYLYSGTAILYTSGNIEHWDAVTKETDLITMFECGRVLTMYWISGTAQPFYVTLETLKTERFVSDGQSSGNDEAEYSISFTALRGEDLQ